MVNFVNPCQYIVHVLKVRGFTVNIREPVLGKYGETSPKRINSRYNNFISYFLLLELQCKMSV